MKFNQENTMAILIDVQERLFPHIYNNDLLEKNCLILTKALIELNVPIMVTEQYRKGLGSTIPSLKPFVDSEMLGDKISFSCYDDSNMREYIKAQSKKNIILFGIESHVCVLQTTIDLLDNGYQVAVIEDCTSSRKKNDKDIAIRRMRQEGAFVSTYESILLEICRYAGSDTFKKISQLII
jgi:nicotinamidase-related amidase